MFDKEFEAKVNSTVAKNLRYYLEINNMNQADLAKHMGVTTATTSNWCKGIKLPRMDKIDKICSIFNIKRSDLIEDRTDKPSDDRPAYTADETTLIDKYRTLNDAGQDKVTDYIDDLASSDKYKRTAASPSSDTLAQEDCAGSTTPDVDAVLEEIKSRTAGKKAI